MAVAACVVGVGRNSCQTMIAERAVVSTVVSTGMGCLLARSNLLQVWKTHITRGKIFPAWQVRESQRRDSFTAPTAVATGRQEQQRHRCCCQRELGGGSTKAVTGMCITPTQHVDPDVHCQSVFCCLRFHLKRSRRGGFRSAWCAYIRKQVRVPAFTLQWHGGLFEFENPRDRTAS